MHLYLFSKTCVCFLVLNVTKRRSINNNGCGTVTVGTRLSFISARGRGTDTEGRIQVSPSSGAYPSHLGWTGQRGIFSWLIIRLRKKKLSFDSCKGQWQVSIASAPPTSTLTLCSGRSKRPRCIFFLSPPFPFPSFQLWKTERGRGPPRHRAQLECTDPGEGGRTHSGGAESCVPA